MLHERGIRADLAGRETGDAHQSASVTAIFRPSQVVILLDPVGAPTSNLQLPPSVLSGLQIVASDEKRPLFRSMPIIPDGLSEDRRFVGIAVAGRSEEHTSELQSLMRISYAVFRLKKKKTRMQNTKENI